MSIVTRLASATRGRTLLATAITPSAIAAAIAAGVAAAIAAGVGLGSAAAGASPAGVGFSNNDRLEDAAEAAFGLFAGEVVTLDIDTTPGAFQQVDVPLGDRIATLDLRPHSVLATNFRLLAQVDGGELVEMQPGPVRTVRGVVLGDPGSIVAGGTGDVGLSATILMADGSRYWIEPVGNRVIGAPLGAHVVYRNEDVVPSNGECGTDDLREQVLDAEADEIQPNGDLLLGGLERAELACDADFEFFEDYGTVAAVAERISLVTNAMNPQYESQVGITHCITAIVVRTVEPDPYSSNSSGALLCQFITEWTDNQQSLDFDVAKLFTGKGITGGTIGQAARIGDICDRQGCCGCGGFGQDDGAFCYSESDCCGSLACATDLMAHELGHLWDAVHCDPCNTTMRSFIGCFNAFSPASVNDIIAHRNSRNCLDNAACDTAAAGGCCLVSGFCIETDTDDCTAQGGTFQGVGVTCDTPEICPEGLGACCYDGDFCVFSTQTDCTDTAGSFQGFGVPCDAQICVQPIGACCFDTNCIEFTESDCADFGGVFQGAGVPCGGDICGAPTGACCFVDGNCTEVNDSECTNAGGEFQGDGGGCTPNDCPQPEPTGACCFTDGSCNVLTDGECTNAGGAYTGDDTGCANQCPQPNECPADLDGDEDVDFQDLLSLLANWGSDGNGADIAEPDDVVNFQDLLGMLAAWGPCK